MCVDSGDSSGVDDLQDDFEEQTITKQGKVYGLWSIVNSMYNRLNALCLSVKCYYFCLLSLPSGLC